MRRTSRGLRGQSFREEASGFTDPDPSHEARDQEEVELLSLPPRGPARWTQPGLCSGRETVPATGVFGSWSLVFGLWSLMDPLRRQVNQSIMSRGNREGVSPRKRHGRLKGEGEEAI